MPQNLLAATARDGRGTWLQGLQQTVALLQERWALEVGEPFQPGGQTAWVAPVRSDAGADLVLKVAWPHPEAEHEADGLRAWDGNGAVRLHAVEQLDDAVALLLERCVPGTALASLPEPEQDVVIAELLRRLWIQPEPGHRFRSLQVMCDAWADEFEQEQAAGESELDPGLAREGSALFRALPATTAQSVLLCTDLHAENVLGARREPWLVIDPKPYVGDPTYDSLQHLLMSDGRLLADPRDPLRRMADLTGLDRERLTLWLFARCVLESPNRPALAEVARRLSPT